MKQLGYWTIYRLEKNELKIISSCFPTRSSAVKYLSMSNTPNTPDIVITSLRYNEAIKQYVSYSRDF